MQETQYTNRLINSNNPYLLSHAHNPVDWYSWGSEAFERAQQEDRPIFVSFGYSTCHWCHVAERTLYANPEIAELMNKWFINIKVDREQRPDLDNLYMLATQLITGQGGWPNNVFLTPDLKPFFAGSYFPPHDATFGRPGFPSVLKAMHESWIRRRQEVQRQAETIFKAMHDIKSQSLSTTQAVPIQPAEWLKNAQDTLLKNYDPIYGGIDHGPTKFPQAPSLSALLQYYSETQDSKTLEAITQTLNAMALGGIRDHLGGGFHRYSTEPTWSIPHFEKMLYDNAQLLKIYTEAYRLTKTPLYRSVAEEIATYLSQQMMAPTGGFYAAQDADVTNKEGLSYVWTQQEIRSILGEEASERFFQVYGLVPLSLSHEKDHHIADSDESGVLRVLYTSPDGHQNPTLDVLATLSEERAKLLAARNTRKQPLRDEKILIAWNALTIDALVYSGHVLEHPEYIEFATKTAEVLWNRAYVSKTYELKHEIFRNKAQISGYLDDYALLGIAFLSLEEANQDLVWRDRAIQLAYAMLRRYPQDHEVTTTVTIQDLLTISPDDGDHTTPSGISAALELILCLYGKTAQPAYAQTAQRITTRLSSTLQQHSSHWASAIVALNRFPVAESPQTQELAAVPMRCNDELCPPLQPSKKRYVST